MVNVKVSKQMIPKIIMGQDHMNNTILLLIKNNSKQTLIYSTDFEQTCDCFSGREGHADGYEGHPL